MTAKSKKILFFGNERLISGLEHTETPLLNGLIRAGYTIVGVVTRHNEATSRKQRTLEIVDTAKKHGIPYYISPDNDEILRIIDQLQPDVSVLAAYGKIVPQNIIDAFPLGIINIHPSLLPKYRGPTPIETALLHGDTETGVSIMQLSAGMDEGPIYYQRMVSIEKNETKLSLYEKLASVSTDILLDNLASIFDGTIQPLPQDNSLATYSRLMNKEDGIIDWNEPGENIIRKMIAYSGWPGVRCTIGDKDVTITSAHFIPSRGPSQQAGDITVIHEIKELGIVCSDGTVYIDTLKPAGKNDMSSTAFLNGAGRELLNN